MCFRKIHNYLVGDLIGSGAFSTVRLAFHSENLKPCALRILSKKKLFNCENFHQIISAEMTIAPFLRHPNIVKIFDLVETKCHIFQFIELCTGGTLADYVLDKQQQRQEANCRSDYYAKMLLILDQICAAVEYLHTHSVCHRDIKLENVLMQHEEAADSATTVKLIDFGFASIPLKKSGVTKGRCGSFEYVAPEVLKGGKYDGLKADMWSLGVMIAKMFGNEALTSNSSEEEMRKAMPIDIYYVVSKLLQKNPDDRLNIYQLRDSPIFSSIRRKTAASSSKIIDFEMPISIQPNNDSDLTADIICRLSEIEEKDEKEVKEELSSNEFRRTKVLFHLIKESLVEGSLVIAKLNAVSENGLTSNAKHSNSLPCICYLGTNDALELKKRKEVRCRAKSFRVLKAIKSLAMENNYCVGTDSNGKRTIMFNTAEEDIKIDFECCDEKKSEGKISFDGKLNTQCVDEDEEMCRVTLYAAPQFEPIASKIIEQISLVIT